MMENILTAGAISMLFLEFVVKPVLRLKLGVQYDFPVKFYVVALPVINLFSALLLAVLDVEGYVLPTNWAGFAKGAILVLLTSLVSVGEYQVAIKPMKDYAEKRNTI